MAKTFFNKTGKQSQDSTQVKAGHSQNLLDAAEGIERRLGAVQVDVERLGSPVTVDGGNSGAVTSAQQSAGLGGQASTVGLESDRQQHNRPNLPSAVLQGPDGSGRSKKTELKDPEYDPLTGSGDSAPALAAPAASSVMVIGSDGGAVNRGRLVPQIDFEETTPAEEKARIKNIANNPPKYFEMDSADPRRLVTQIGELAEKSGPTGYMGGVIPRVRTKASRERQKKTTIRSAGRQFGSAGMEEVISDPSVRLEEMSVPIDLLVNMWRHPTSQLRDIISTVLGDSIDQKMMAADFEYASMVMLELFNNNDIAGVFQKTVNDEATTHWRIVRAHVGSGIRIHPSIVKQFNADFDGDELLFTTDPQIINGVKNATDLFIGTEGDIRIDVDYFVIHPTDDLNLITDFVTNALRGFAHTDEQLQGLIEATKVAATPGSEEEGVKSMARWAKAISQNPNQQYSPQYIAGGILLNIYEANRDIKEIASHVAGDVDEFGALPETDREDLGTEISLGIVEHVEEDGTVVLSRGLTSIPANMYDVKSAINAPIGTWLKKNMHFRIDAAMGKASKVARFVMGLGSAINRKTFLDVVAMQMAGIQEADERVRAVSGIVKRSIIEHAGMPSDIKTEADFNRFMSRFITANNSGAYLVSAANVAVRLNKMLDYSQKRFHMPSVPDANGRDKKSVIARKAAARKAFRWVYGDFRMGALFGKNAPEGWEDATLNEYIAGNQEPPSRTGESSAEYSNIGEFIGRLADMRTTTSRSIHEKFTEATMKMFDKNGDPLLGNLFTALVAQQKKLMENPKSVTSDTEAAALLEMLVDAYYFLGPDIFSYLGLDDPARFFETPLGRKLAYARSVDQLQGAVYTAIITYHFSPVYELRDKYYQAADIKDYRTMAKCVQEIEHTLNSIESSSDALAAVVREYRAMSVYGMEPQSRDVMGFNKGTDDRIFSNFYGMEEGQSPIWVELDGQRYPSVENAYQAAKTLDPEARKVFQVVMASEARSLGRKLPNIREDWDSVKKDVMRHLIKQKFVPGSPAGEALIATGTGRIVELNNWGDTTWGMVMGKDSQLVGDNELGKLIMERRAEIQGEVPVALDLSTGDNVISYIFMSDRGGAEIRKMLTQLVNDDPLSRSNKEEIEITADLYANPKGEFATNRFLSDFGHTQLMDNLKTSKNKAATAARQDFSKMSKQVAKHFNILDKGELSKFLNKVSQEPEMFVEFTPSMVTDAVLTCMEKAFASTEKGQQEQALAYLFAQVNLLKNGGVWSHATIGGDFSVNKISAESLWNSPVIIAKLLTDPNFSIYVFDQYGRDLLDPNTGKPMALSQEVLFGKTDPSEEEVASWLVEHPRAAMALRRVAIQNKILPGDQVAGVIATSDIGEMIRSVNNFDNSSDLALKKLADKPGFYALVALSAKMQGNRRFQLRDQTNTNVSIVIALLRSLSKSPASIEEVTSLVDSWFTQSFIDSGMSQEDAEKHLGEMIQFFNDGKDLGNDVPDSEDIRYDERYQVGQVRDKMITHIFNYANELHNDERISALDVSPTLFNGLFKLSDPSTIRSFFDVEQMVSTSQTAQSTGINGAMSRRLLPLMFLSFIRNGICDGPPAEPISKLEFKKNFDKYVGRKVMLSSGKFSGRYVTVNETTLKRIIDDARHGNGMIHIQDAAMCTNPILPCFRHATADQSTNFNERQTPALVRMLTIVRTLAAEQLNLKVKTVGDDGKDSIVKFMLFENEFTSTGAQNLTEELNELYNELVITAGEDGIQDPEAHALAAVRRRLAQHLKGTFSSLGYDEQIRIDDFINIAQTMIQVQKSPEDGSSTVRIFSLGQINQLVGQAIQETESRIKNPTHQEYIDATLAYLADPARLAEGASLEGILSGVKVHGETVLTPQLLSTRESSLGRNFELVMKLTSLNAMHDKSFRVLAEQSIDSFEKKLIEWVKTKFPSAPIDGRVGTWTTWEKSDSDQRSSYRLIGYFGEGKNYQAIKAVGPRNAYVIRGSIDGSVASSYARQAIIDAHNLGINVFIEGELPESDWKHVRKTIGYDPRESAIESPPHTPPAMHIPFFDLHLNGRNTTAVQGAFDAETIYSDEKNIGFFFESQVNEHQAGDSSFIPTEFFDSIPVERRGQWTVNINTAFANLRRAIRSGQDRPMVPQKAWKEEGAEGVVIAIVGAKNFTSYDTFRNAVERLSSYKKGLIKEVITYDQAGTNRLVQQWAKEHDIKLTLMSADVYNIEAPGAVLGRDKFGRAINLAAFANRDQLMAQSADTIVALGVKRESADDMKNVDSTFEKFKAAGKNRVFFDISGNKMYLNNQVHRMQLNNYKVQHGIPEAVVATAADIDTIISKYESGDLNEIMIDLGVTVRKGSAEDVAFEEGLIRFIKRVKDGELSPGGWLTGQVRIGEIAAFVKVDTNHGPVFHPVRPFEHGNHAGAPTYIEVNGIAFDHETGNLILDWQHTGTLKDRYFKIFEDGFAANKFMGLPTRIPNMALRDGGLLLGYVAKAATGSRRLLYRRQQKIMTLFYRSRMGLESTNNGKRVWGYNVAEERGAMPAEIDATVKEALLTGKTDLGLWVERLRNKEPITFYTNGDSYEDINRMLNTMVQRCVDYGIDPTYLLASHHNGVPNKRWFNYMLLFDGSDYYMDTIMKWMHRMNPGLVANGIKDKTANAIFDHNLQVLRPVLGKDGSHAGWERVDMYGGFHFFDEHFAGFSGSGTKVATYSPAALPAMMAGGMHLEKKMLEEVLRWGGNIRDHVAGLSSTIRVSNTK